MVQPAPAGRAARHRAAATSTSAHAAGPTKVAPPKAAIEACQGKKEGDVVQLPTSNGNAAKAVCRKVNGQLAAQRTASIGPVSTF